MIPILFYEYMRVYSITQFPSNRLFQSLSVKTLLSQRLRQTVWIVRNTVISYRFYLVTMIEAHEITFMIRHTPID